MLNEKGLAEIFGVEITSAKAKVRNTPAQSSRQRRTRTPTKLSVRPAPTKAKVAKHATAVKETP